MQVPGVSDRDATQSDSNARSDRHTQPMWWLILAALSTWSYMAVWSANADELAGFSLVHFFVWTLCFLAIGAAVQRLFYAVLRGPSKPNASFAVAAVVLIMIQSWNSRLTEGLGLGLRLAVHGALTLVVAAIVIRLASAFPHVRPVLGVVTIFLVGAAYLTLLGQAWGWLNEDQRPSVSAASISIPDGTRDVFVVILDEYTSSSVLEKDFGMDNTVFETGLSASGLNVVPGAMSNYTNTLLSVGGVLTGRYPTVGAPADHTYRDLVRIHSGDNLLFASLQAAGYEIHLFDNAWTFTRCGPNVDVCHGGGLNELDWLVAKRTPLFDLISWFQLSPWIRGSLTQFDQATRLAEVPTDGPRLVYVHALIPHAPLQLDDDCSLVLPGLGSLDGVINSPDARSAYLSQVRCVNSLVLDLVEAIPEDAIVFVTGDHGVRWAGADLTDPALSAEEAARTLGVLTAYRFPGSCESIPAGSSVQRSAAGLFECLGIQLDVEPVYSPSQPDRHFANVAWV